MIAGIIGGTGRMGRLFAPVFERAGCEVLVSGRSTTLTARDIALQADIVIVSVPIRDTVRVINEIAPLLTREQLLCDFTSLKVKPVEAMLASKANVIGLHPMFGPTVKTLKHQTIIVCPARTDEKHLHDLLALFRAEGAECTITTPEQHDRTVAVVQGLTHFVTLCMADSIRRLGIDIEKTQAFTSPVYQIELSLVGRLLSQDPALYADILQMNPYVPEVIDACRSSTTDLEEIVKQQDPDLFRVFFEKNSRHLGPYCNEGQKMTDALIECMVEHDNTGGS
ncbi:MAG: prephenate dehydrogenase/arogenate dehydrogenase family protein [Methanomicrobiales archaeon]|nr:prephenate dehydrogenase/arogenate dehydrogenase family protein [Methanomicrobiales archaeon]